MRTFCSHCAFVVMLAVAAPAHAFGINDLISIGVQAGGEILRAAGGKAVDAVKDSMRDPEAEALEKAEKERQLAEQMQKQIDEIEAKPNLRPIDRERLVLQLKQTWRASKEMQAFVERAEAQQKAERDKVLTFGGIAGVVGRAALNTPSMVMAQADLMTKNPLWRAQQRLNNEAVFRAAGAQVAAGIPQAKARIALAQADVLQKTGIQQAGTEAVVKAAEETARQGVRKEDVEKVADVADPVSTEARDAAPAPQPEAQAALAGAARPEAAPDQVAQAPGDAFSPDLGKKLYVEFVDSPSETRKLREMLASRGHALVETREDAEVVYLIEGEFMIPETKLHDGMTKSLGAFLENPAQAIEPPAKKVIGSIGAGLSRFMLAAAGAQAPENQASGYRQSVLLVIARQPKDGKETRVSVVQKAQGETIEASSLAKAAKEALYRDLGI